MLVLSRKKNEAICINGGCQKPGGITIVLAEVRGDKATIGVIAHPDIPVHRAEVQEAINRAARDAKICNESTRESETPD